MDPRTIFDWIDQSDIPAIEDTTTDLSPMFYYAMSTDKGPEDLRIVNAQTLNKLYGTPSFVKHGQVSIQAKRSADAGARLLVQRIVAEDAKLANVVVVAQLSTEQIQKINSNGEPLYKTSTGAETTLAFNNTPVMVQKKNATEEPIYVKRNGIETTLAFNNTAVMVQKKNASDELLYRVSESDTTETTDVTDFPIMIQKTVNGKLIYIDASGKETTNADENTPVMVQKTDSMNNLVYLDSDSTETTDRDDNTVITVPHTMLNFTTETFDDINSMEGIELQITQLYDKTTKKFPLFNISAIGRGLCNLKFRILPDYTSSKNSDFVLYEFIILENNKKIETIKFGINPNIIWGGVNYGLQTQINTHSTQVRANMFESYFEEFINTLVQMTGIEQDILLENDILFAKQKNNLNLPYMSIKADSTNLQHIYGIEIPSGDNGSFGNAPILSSGYESELVKAFNGELTEDIYDLVRYPIAAIIDANYPAEVKRAIEDYVEFREDCQFFRDLGFVYTIEQIKTVGKLGKQNKFIYQNHLSYDIIDPNSMKQIKVTVSWSLAKLLVDHLMYGAYRPLAGILHNFVIDDAIPGTINYIPKVVPGRNQREELSDARINYGSYYDGQFVLETQYTSQVKHTQLSYTNNVLAVQEVIRAVRAECPRMRYSFINGKDLDRYKEDVQRILNRYKNNFATLDFEYIEDTAMLQNKIFYAAIKVSFRNYVQSEYFKIYAIN